MNKTNIWAVSFAIAMVLVTGAVTDYTCEDRVDVRGYFDSSRPISMRVTANDGNIVDEKPEEIHLESYVNIIIDEPHI